MNAADLLIAIIEDEAPIRRFLRASLCAEGFRVREAESVAGGLRVITQQCPDLVLLDLGLPDGDGVDIIHSVREWSLLPILVLSARGEERAKIMALDAGADDYLTKPFGIGELLARVRVGLRHAARTKGSSAGEQISFEFGDIYMDLASRSVRKGDVELKLTKREFELLAILARNADKVLTHRFLLSEVWGPNSIDEPHYVRVFIANLRKKLEDNPSRPRYLLTEQGVGYRLKTD
jgi:two-component system, OmpR family, KDP operon response regulator KdpE